SYDRLTNAITALAGGLHALGLGAGQRVGIYLDKRVETVVAFFGTSAAGGVFVPINPILKREQVGYILRDCNVAVLVTSVERLRALLEELPECPDLKHIVLTDAPADAPSVGPIGVHRWSDVLDG